MIKVQSYVHSGINYFLFSIIKFHAPFVVLSFHFGYFHLLQENILILLSSKHVLTILFFYYKKVIWTSKSPLLFQNFFFFLVDWVICWVQDIFSEIGALFIQLGLIENLTKRPTLHQVFKYFQIIQYFTWIFWNTYFKVFLQLGSK